MMSHITTTVTETYQTLRHTKQCTSLWSFKLDLMQWKVYSIIQLRLAPPCLADRWIQPQIRRSTILIFRWKCICEEGFGWVKMVPRKVGLFFWLVAKADRADTMKQVVWEGLHLCCLCTESNMVSLVVLCGQLKAIVQGQDTSSAYQIEDKINTKLSDLGSF